MIIENKNNEIIIRISPNVNLEEIQQSLDFIRYKEIISKSKATQKDVDDLAQQVNANWWKENKSKYISALVKIIVDTNIVFSAIISDKGKIGKILLNKPIDIQFLSPHFLLKELDLHTGKILSLTGYSDYEYEQIKSFITKNIEFIDPDIITKENWSIAYELIKDIDEKDISFLALNFEFDGLLWTGDKKLIKGLQNKNYDKIVTTDKLHTKYFGL